ncbi:MAG: hypothetical protein HYW95_00580 [Candidatus Wildermuthbacteria bacterium]|nr:hypothetical protein [Candidatus Wildermuthbacteria bacterium]
MKGFLLRHKRTLAPIIGFGLAGAIWGIEAYRGTVGSNETFTNPFSYILGAVAFGILGSLSLVLFSGDRKLMFKVMSIGTLGWLMSFIIPMIWIEWLVIWGTVLLEFLLPSEPNEFLSKIFYYWDLQPSLRIGVLYLEFAIVGLFTGTLYGILLKKNLIKIGLATATSLLSTALISPIIGNYLGESLSSLLSSYIFTFLFMGCVLGWMIASAIRYGET